MSPAIIWKRTIGSTIGLLLCVGCASDAEKNLEEARFLLDKGEFAQAETKARSAVAENPADTGAQFTLASALIGVSFLGDGTYLGKLASLQDAAAGSGFGFQTIASIAPSAFSGEEYTKLQEARDILIGIADSCANEKDCYLQLYMARIFEIAAVNQIIGGATADNVCNADPTQAVSDGIPDGLDTSGLDSAQAQRFQDNLDNVNSDGVKAGLPSDFSLTDHFFTLSSGLSDAIAVAGSDQLQGAKDYLNSQYGVGAVCP
ncbi:MAG TPA: hypothetical protein VI895_05585 [Bdellovibrionota bacterium]|nr:hypothetical protein [Bdellovibrionota bacterium]